jgi:hypothetical protein
MKSINPPTVLLAAALRTAQDELYQVPPHGSERRERRQLIRRLDMLSHLLLISSASTPNVDQP